MNWQVVTNQILDACKDSFGEDCIHRPLSGGTETFTGIFDAETVQIDSITGMAVLSPQPRLGVKLSDFTSEPKQGDIVTLRECNWQVVSVQKDGNGGAVLSIHKKL
jgi:hypothetical protein